MTQVSAQKRGANLGPQPMLDNLFVISRSLTQLPIAEVIVLYP